MPETPEAPDGDLVPRPLVYGYIRAEKPDEIEIAAWKKEIGQFCEEHSYRLQNVFVDRYEPDDRVQRPGLAVLLDRLMTPDAHGVVLVHLDHLSAKNKPLAVLRQNIRRTGSQVIVIHEQPDGTTADGA